MSDIEEQTQNDDDLEILIEEIKNKPVLFDYTHREYKNTVKKEIVWEVIAASMKREVTWCKAKWKYLRDNYKRKKNQLKGKSGDAAKRIRKWPYFQFLEFLGNFTDDAITSGNLIITPDAEARAEDDEKEEEYVESPVTPKPQSSMKRRKRDTKEPDNVEKAIIDYIGANKNTPIDSHHYFGLGLAERLRALTPQASAFAKMRIEQVLYEVEYPPPMQYYDPINLSNVKVEVKEPEEN